MDCYIIGKGSSLNYLTPDMIGEGVVITLNHAITKISSFCLSNPIYCMFKDGPGVFTRSLKTERCNVSCDECFLGYSVPENATVLVHKYHSLYCFEDKKRLIFDNTEMGLDIFDFSALSAIKIAQLIGCNKIYLVSFDSVTSGDCTNILGTGHDQYLKQHKKLFGLLKEINHEWITPMNGKRANA